MTAKVLDIITRKSLTKRNPELRSLNLINMLEANLRNGHLKGEDAHIMMGELLWFFDRELHARLKKQRVIIEKDYKAKRKHD